MAHRELFPGHFINFGYHENERHIFGGTHDCGGAWCPNCEMPLMLHLTIDLTDPVIALGGLPTKRIGLFYCMRCALSWHDFSYRIVDDGQIEIMEAFHGETDWEGWYSEGGETDCFPEIAVRLAPIPKRLQVLYDKLNENEDLTKDEQYEVASYTGHFARPEAGGYPIVDVVNQLGGRSFLCQRLRDPSCPGCRKVGLETKDMYFLASLTNDPTNDIRISYAGVQIVFFLCRQCGTIKVRHSI